MIGQQTLMRKLILIYQPIITRFSLTRWLNINSLPIEGVFKVLSLIIKVIEFLNPFVT
jgi:hypothetical protein